MVLGPLVVHDLQDVERWAAVRRPEGRPAVSGVTDCARCGSCCEKIWLTADPRRWSARALEGVPDPRTDDGWSYWLEHTTLSDGGRLAGQDRDAVLASYDPAGHKRADADFVAAHFTEHCDGYWTCDAYDPERRECTAHQDRPPLCSGYPWYGDEPSAERAERVHQECSYLADLPPADRPEGARPLIPLTPV